MSSVLHTDQLGRKVEVPISPRRIVSIVPSQTELLYHLGLHEEVVGITKFCIHPEVWFKTKTRVGGTKQLHLDKIRELKPDLILANKEENDVEQIRTLCKEFPVWISDIRNLEESLAMILSVGEITDRIEKSQQLIGEIQLAADSLHPAKNRTAAYFIWNDPLMSVNRDTFIHAMMKHAGFINVFVGREDSRYPIISEQDLIDANPEIVLLSSEPFPFEQKHADYFQSILPDSKVLLVDGEMFSWYGSRLVHSFDYFATLWK
ncbi:MAG: ABC transporter substrate-binding protein [Flavobacteriales bacterium]